MSTVAPSSPGITPTAVGNATGNAVTSPADKAALHAAAQKFEAMMVRQMLAEARKTDFGDKLMSNEGTKTFREMQDSRFADAAAKTGSLGFANIIEAQLSRQSHPGTTTTQSTASATSATGKGR